MFGLTISFATPVKKISTWKTRVLSLALVALAASIILSLVVASEMTANSTALQMQPGMKPGDPISDDDKRHVERRQWFAQGSIWLFIAGVVLLTAFALLRLPGAS